MGELVINQVVRGKDRNLMYHFIPNKSENISNRV